MPDSLAIVKQFFPKVKRVVDAKKTVYINLTQKDVNAAKRKDHNGCAMVEACKRELKARAIVSTRTAFVTYDAEPEVAYRFTVPASVTREITSFDRGSTFAPGEYSLGKPQKRLPRGSGTRHAGAPGAGTLRHAQSHAPLQGVRDSLPSMRPAPKRKRKAKR